MKLKFWQKDEDNLDDITGKEMKDDPLTSDFGGPGMPSATPESVEHDIKPRFDEFSGRQPFQPVGEPRDVRRDEVLEAKIDSMKSKLEIVDHKLDMIITRIKDVY